MTSLTIGKTVTVKIDFGQDLADFMFLTITTCTLSSNGNSIDIIKDGIVPSIFIDMVKPMNSTLNSEAKFTWTVFQLGRLSTAFMSCKIRLNTSQELYVSNIDIYFKKFIYPEQLSQGNEFSCGAFFSGSTVNFWAVVFGLVRK